MEINKNIRKVDGISLVTGNARFVDDENFDNMLFCKFLRSPIAHGRIRSIDTKEAEGMEGVILILHHLNTERVLHTTAGQGYPEPSPYDTAMFDNKVRFVGDPVALVAAESEKIAEEALGKINVEYEELPAVLHPEKAIESGIIIHDEEDSFGIYDRSKNIAGHIEIDIGDVEKAYNGSKYQAEFSVMTHYSQHTPIEPHIAISYLDEKGRLVIRTSTQVPFHSRRICAMVLGIPEKNIRVIKPRIGGGFGTKQEILLDYYVGLVTLRTSRPARISLTRSEEFISRTRHPMNVSVRISADDNARINSIDLQVLSNTGAYGSHALTVMFNSGSKTLPLYKAENVRFNGTTVYTNLPVAGAYRGYGATQGYAAIEQAIDILAEKIGMDPVEFRKLNHIKKDETSPVFKALGEGKEGVPQYIRSTSLEEAIEWGLTEIDWSKRVPHDQRSGRFRRGLGMGIFMQGSGIPLVDMASASIKMNDDGSFNLNVGATDLGTGSDTILSQIAAEELRTKTDEIVIYSSDTDMTPFDVGAYASSTTFVSGNAVKRAAGVVLDQIRTVASKMLKTDIDNIVCENSKCTDKVSNKAIHYSEIAKYSLYSHDQFQIGTISSFVGDTSPPPFMACFTEIEVDTLTGMIKVIKFVAGVDCGVAINPNMAEGQVEGAIVNGLSYALTERFIFNEKGAVQNRSFQDYKIYSIADMTDLRIKLFKTHEPAGPFGAKSVSEIGINGPIPVISNALYNALGVRPTTYPLSPDYVIKLLEGK